MFEEVTLYTRDAREVTVVRIPKFTPQAEVLMWGTRVFVLTPDMETGVRTYKEGMLFAIPSVE